MQRGTLRPPGVHVRRRRPADRRRRPEQHQPAFQDRELLGRARRQGATRRQGYASRATSAMLTLGFTRARARAIHTWIVEHNPSVERRRRVGFRPIGRQRQCHYIDGRAYDRLWFDLLASEHEEIPDVRRERDCVTRSPTLFRRALHLDVPSSDTDLFETGVLDSLAFVELLLAARAANSASRPRSTISRSTTSDRSRASPSSSPRARRRHSTFIDCPSDSSIPHSSSSTAPRVDLRSRASSTLRLLSNGVYVMTSRAAPGTARRR